MELIEEDTRIWKNNRASWGKKNVKDLQRKFKNWMIKYNKRKWNECKGKHKLELKKLNAEIKEEEIIIF